MDTPKRTELGKLYAHRLTREEAIDAIVALCRARAGGTVLTPNVDHVCMAEENAALAAAYAGASLSLVDGKPLVWLSQLVGSPLPEKISGSDLAEPLAARATREGLSLFLLGAADGVGARAAEILCARHPGLRIVGTLAPRMGFERDTAENARVVRAVQEAAPDLVFVCLGAPKQELWMAAHRAALAPAVMIGLGATLDFIAGRVRRAPTWVSEAGLEWLYRLALEPRRLAGRYLVRDRAFARIALRAWIASRRAPAHTADG